MTAPLVREKIGLQELWKEGLDWDHDLVLKGMEQLNQISLERCLCPVVPGEPPTLCVFADASRGAFETCAYPLRSEEPAGAINVRFVAAKSRVARVGKIQDNVLSVQWRHIPTEHNVSDDVSRGSPVAELSDRIKNFKKFKTQNSIYTILCLA